MPSGLSELRRMIHANQVAARARVAGLGANAAHVRLGPWDLIDTGDPGFAIANGAAVVDTAVEDDLAPAIEWFDGRGIPHSFDLRSDADAHLIAALERLGYVPTGVLPAMVLRDPQPRRPAAPLTIREVSDAGDIDQYGAVNWPVGARHTGVKIARTSARLGFVLLLGEVEGEAVACSMAVVTGRLTGIYNVAVELSHRQRGVGEAMTWAAIEAGRARGADLAWLASSEMGLRTYQRMGFEALFDYVDMSSVTPPP
jgi:ribosomal protein S18 acetylase RimI-like enzyme